MQKTKIKFRFICFFLAITGTWSCNSEEKTDSKEKIEAQEQVVLIFEDSLARRFFRQRKAVFKYLDDNQLPVEITFDSKEFWADFIINTNREFLDLVYRDNSQVEFTYYIQNGDSIFIQEKDKKPWLTSVSSDNDAFNMNLELIRNIDLYGKPYSKTQDFYYLWSNSKMLPFQSEANEDLERLKKESLESFMSELNWIDSMVDNGQITAETQSFFALKNGMERKKLEAHEPDSLIFNTKVAIESFLEMDEAHPDYSVYLDEFSEMIIVSQTQAESNDMIDSLMIGSELNFLEKSLVFKYLQKNIPFLSFKEVDEVLQKFGDKLVNREQLLFLNASNHKLLGLKPDMELIGLQKSSTTFEELLYLKRGKYLYVDLWAAWCVPCIKAFPASLALNEKYKNRGVEVIFLSVDENYKFWEEVALKYGIGIPEQSFVVMRKNESSYLQALNVALIPRYLIFDPEGKLIHPNAPRPESEELRSFLDRITNPI